MFTPFDVMRLSLQTGMMLAQAQTVMAMRMMGMAGVWRVAPGENRRMVDEKGSAALAAGLAMTRAALAGKGPLAVAGAGLQPIARRTRANAKRLGKRGMKVGI